MTEQPSGAKPSNRNMIMMVASAIAVLGIIAAMWQEPVDQPKPVKRPPPPAEVPVTELMAPTGLADLSYGKADAPVTIVEYASLTCPHCATFHKTVLPQLKTKYIDTGKVRLIYREFPLDQLAGYLATLTRCAGEDKTLAMAGDFFTKSDTWLPPAGNPEAGITKIWEDHGMKQDQLKTCLNNKEIYSKIMAATERASDKFGVRSTPTFFINGKRMTERSDIIESFDKMIAPLVNG